MNGEANVAENQRANIEESMKGVVEHNQIHATTNVDLDSKICIVKAENDKL